MGLPFKEVITRKIAMLLGLRAQTNLFLRITSECSLLNSDAKCLQTAQNFYFWRFTVVIGDMPWCLAFDDNDSQHAMVYANVFNFLQPGNAIHIYLSTMELLHANYKNPIVATSDEEHVASRCCWNPIGPSQK